ncbi:MAG: amidohydrolase family protein [Planctomycetes bacterium]|nr:amidohydrolase family protein [Planctomycetota bacterium]
MISFVAAAILAAVPVPGAEEPAPLAIRAAKILTMAGPPIEDGAIIISGKKIAAVGPWRETPIPAAARILDARPDWAMPGLVDVHSHAGGIDWNDMVQPTNAGMHIRDSIVPDSPILRYAIAGGVTTILFLPGSGTNQSGWGVVMKTAGRTAEEMVIREPGVIKIAQAGNPERMGGDLGYGRMGMNWILREELRRGREYSEAWRAYERGERATPPPKSIELEPFRQIFEEGLPAAVHTQWYQVVLATLRIIADEYGIETLTDHSTFGAWQLAPEAARRKNVRVGNGPRQLWYEPEMGEIIGLAGAWYRGGVRDVCINTDAPVIPQEELFYQASVSVNMGLPPEAALRGITIEAAKALKIADRVGSLESGKDADILIVTGDVLDVRTRVERAIVDGRLVYDASRERRF